MSRLGRLTARAQDRVQQYLKPGDLAIDATVGNGYDTCFLAKQVGEEGLVFGFDIQQQALIESRSRLEATGLAEQVILISGSHENMAEQIPAELRGKFKAVMFNLGYLPGSDKSTVTRAQTTLPAISQALDYLAPGGIMTILAYRGHEGGSLETEMVDKLLSRLDKHGYRVEREESPGPVLYTVLVGQA